MFVTDNEIWTGDIHSHQALVEYLQKTVIDAKLVLSAVTPKKFSITGPTDSEMLEVAGFGPDLPP